MYNEELLYVSSRRHSPSVVDAPALFYFLLSRFRDAAGTVRTWPQQLLRCRRARRILGYKAYMAMPNQRSAALLLLFGSAAFVGLLFSSGHHNNNRKRRRPSRKLLEAGGTVPVHPQCARGNPDGIVDRPLLLYKYSRTGSTWLAWSGKTLRATKRPMIWTHEAQKCTKKPLWSHLLQLLTRNDWDPSASKITTVSFPYLPKQNAPNENNGRSCRI